MLKHPVIGLNMSMDLIDKYEKFDFLVPVGYVDAVIGAGGIPICIPPYPNIEMIQRFLPILDGFVLIGGDDYRPEHYGGHPQPENELMPERRDRFDLMLAKWILHETAMPVLGVCGGHQLISIAQGGALVQDIRTEWKDPTGKPPLLHSGRERNDGEKNEYRHAVRQEKNSLIAQVTKIASDEDLMTNSYHHQAVHPQRVGNSLRPSAWAADGVIEAIEPAEESPWARSGRFVLGIQWHPERTQDEDPHKNIFCALIEAARRK
jgi:putative glutamine amidotransferase